MNSICSLFSSIPLLNDLSIRLTCLLVLGLAYQSNLLGQYSINCGFEIAFDPPPPNHEQSIVAPCTSGAPAGPYYLRVYPHILRAEDMTGGVDPEAVEGAISRMNEVFNIHNIYLVSVCEHESFYIDSDSFFRRALENKCDLFSEFNHTDGIDIYFDDIDSPRRGGEAIDIPGDAFIVSGINDPSESQFPGLNPILPVIETHTVSHEMGHCLGLYHTHHAYEEVRYAPCTGTYHYPGDSELINCSQGDFCCDTPPDYNMGYWVDFSDNCRWFAPDFDSELEIFNPDTRNIMGYTTPPCLEHFTEDQGERMRCAISGTSALRACLVDFEVDLTINTNTTWSVNSILNEGDFIITNSLIVKSGKQLIIEENVRVKFMEQAKLIIEPNASVHLYGSLTSGNCDGYWQGVKVYGDSEHNQHPVTGYYQGYLKGYPGSLIENAQSAVELWGPTEDETGGVISCNGTTFKNNRSGVIFFPFENIIGGQPRPYVGKFTLCDFNIDDDYPFNSFNQHLLLFGVEGVQIAGCEFSYSKLNNNAMDQLDFGWGVAAIDAGFNITSASSIIQTPGPCIPGNCTVLKRSSFKGLGKGIYAGSYSKNRYFSVYQTDFDACYTGIEIDGVSGGVMLFNRFHMGLVLNPNVFDGNQVGIKLNQEIGGFTIEQDSFYGGNINVNNTIGISVENLGEMNNVIRNNYFSGLTISNEAYGKNASTSGVDFGGLRYLCNKNLNIAEKDFFVKNTQAYLNDNVSKIQADYDGLRALSAGNKFSSSGNSEDGDFGNYGNVIREYHYHPSDGTLDAIFGIGLLINSSENLCSLNYCAPPCLPTISLNNLIQDFYDKKEDYNIAITNELYEEAGRLKIVMDNSAKIIIQHILIDTVTFDRDTLRKWYSNLNTMSGDILLAKDLVSMGDFEAADSVLNLCTYRHALSFQQEKDILNIKAIFNIMERCGFGLIDSLSIDTLHSITDSLGHCASMARSLLFTYGYRYETDYVLPAGSPPGFAIRPATDEDGSGEINVFPNPNYNGVVNISMPSFEEEQGDVVFEVWTITGSKVFAVKLVNRYSKVNLRDSYNGLYIYRILKAGNILDCGKLLFLE